MSTTSEEEVVTTESKTEETIEEPIVLEEWEGEFITWHNSNGDVHLRTSRGILFISKKSEDLITKSKTYNRGELLKVKGQYIYSKTLSNQVFEISEFI